MGGFRCIKVWWMWYITPLFCDSYSDNTILHSTVSYCAALHSTALQCNELHCTPLHCTALHWTVLHFPSLYCSALHCTALHWTALHWYKHCTVEWSMFMNKIIRWYWWKSSSIIFICSWGAIITKKKHNEVKNIFLNCMWRLSFFLNGTTGKKVAYSHVVHIWGWPAGATPSSL